jgi:hypothetical protein
VVRVAVYTSVSIVNSRALAITLGDGGGGVRGGGTTVLSADGGGASVVWGMRGVLSVGLVAVGSEKGRVPGGGGGYKCAIRS